MPHQTVNLHTWLLPGPHSHLAVFGLPSDLAGVVNQPLSKLLARHSFICKELQETRVVFVFVFFNTLA